VSKSFVDIVGNVEDVEVDSAPISPVTPVVSRRPENYARSFFHVMSAAAALVMLRLIPHREWLIVVSGSLALMAWIAETTRRIHPPANVHMMRFFSRIAHEEETHKVNSSTWYLTALLGLALFAPLRSAELGVVVLGLADPAAGFIGRRIGRTKIRKNRSLEGTLGFVAVGWIAAMTLLLVFYPLPLPQMAAIAAVASVAGAIVEVATIRLDDNFTIPVTVAIASASFEHVLLSI
jgi:dolichol kinase